MARKPTTSPATRGDATRTSGAKASHPKPSRRKTTREKQESGAKATSDKSTRTRSTTSPWEWVSAGIGAAIFIALVGYLVYAGLTRPEHPNPDIVATAGGVIRLESGTFLLPLTVTNLGADTGANVTVRGTLRDGSGALVEESSTTFNDAAQHSTTEGGLYFTTDPESGVLSLRVEGYADP